jgi:hypothetical protein
MKRYKANSKSLDLRQFHTDPGERMLKYSARVHTHEHKQRMFIHTIYAEVHLTKTVTVLKVCLYGASYWLASLTTGRQLLASQFDRPFFFTG